MKKKHGVGVLSAFFFLAMHGMDNEPTLWGTNEQLHKAICDAGALLNREDLSLKELRDRLNKLHEQQLRCVESQKQEIENTQNFIAYLVTQLYEQK